MVTVKHFWVSDVDLDAFPVDGDVDFVLKNMSALDNLSLRTFSYRTFSKRVRFSVLFPSPTGADRQFKNLNTSSSFRFSTDRPLFSSSLMTSSS